jgi:hypothetical protein
MLKPLKGTDVCYVCGKTINWESERIPQSGCVTVYKIPENTADIIACGRNNDGTVRFEILCRCPQCKTRNKFYRDIEM